LKLLLFVLVLLSEAGKYCQASQKSLELAGFVEGIRVSIKSELTDNAAYGYRS
jgi:hypothetical protein